MRLQVLSDIHIDMHTDGGEAFYTSLRPEGVEMLVVAGDLGEADDQYEYAVRQLCQMYRHVLIVPGNHEFYNHGRSREAAVDRQERLGALEAKYPNLVYAAKPQVLRLNGFKIIAGTMWFPDNGSNSSYYSLMNDFSAIPGFLPWVYDQNVEFTRLLEHELTEGDVVITHHLPSEKSTPARFSRSSVNRFFVSDHEQLILDRKPSLWVHGHTHDGCRYTLGETEIVCNPYGYEYERTKGEPYSPNLYLDLEIS